MKALALAGPVLALGLVVLLHRLEVWTQRSAGARRTGSSGRAGSRRKGGFADE